MRADDLAPFIAAPFIDAADVRDVDAAGSRPACRRLSSRMGAHDFTALLTDPSVFALAVRLRSWFGARRITGFVLVRFAADEAEILTVAVGSRHRRREVTDACSWTMSSGGSIVSTLHDPLP